MNWEKFGLLLLTVAFIVYIIGMWMYNTTWDVNILCRATGIATALGFLSLLALFVSFSKDP